MSSGVYRFYIWDMKESDSDELHKRIMKALEDADLEHEFIGWDDE